MAAGVRARGALTVGVYILQIALPTAAGPLWSPRDLQEIDARTYASARRCVADVLVPPHRPPFFVLGIATKKDEDELISGPGRVYQRVISTTRWYSMRAAV